MASISLPASLSALGAPLTHSAVFEAFEKEFSPLLDSTLIAALLLEVDFDTASPNGLESSIRTVHETLQSIATHAEAEAAAEELQDLDIQPSADNHRATADVSKTSKSSKGKRQRSATATTSVTDTTAMTTTTDTGTWPQTASKSDSGSSKSDSSSPSSGSNSADVDPHALAFLRTALPHLSTRTLINALVEWEERQRVQAESGGGEGDIWTLISSLVEKEEEDEMDERGLEFEAGSGEIALLDEDAVLYLGGIGYEDGEKEYQAQLDADEKLARELALQFEAEESRDPILTVLPKKGEDVNDGDWVIPGKKDKGKKSKAMRKDSKRDSTMKISLNNVRPQGQVFQQSNGIDRVNGGKGDKVVPDVDLDVFLPSLSSYLASLLPVDRPPSTMFLQANASSSSKSSEDKAKASIAAYIQNVFLNDRVVKSKYDGKVYKAVRACLESVMQVVEEVKANARHKREAQAQANAQVRLEKQKEEEAQQLELMSHRGNPEIQRRENGSRHERRKGGGEGRGGRGGRGKRLPPEEPPHPPSRKMKTRVRTATDRDRESERDPGGQGGQIDGAVTREDKKENGGEGREGEEDKVASGEVGESNDQQLLFTLLDILLPQYALVDSEEGVYVEVHQLLSDIELCIAVLSGSEKPAKEQGAVGSERDQGESALDLATLLCELYVSDADPGREAVMFMDMLADGGNYGDAWGKRQPRSYAQTVGASRHTRLEPKAGASSSSGAARAGTVGRTSTVQEPGSAQDERKKHKPSPYQWQAVPTRKAQMKKAYTILPHLPTYKRDVNGMQARDDVGVRERSTTWVPGSASEYEEAEREHRRRVHDNERRRKELLREAARMWNRSTQGPIAFYFAERAQECLDAARQESVNAARAMVLRKQVLSGDGDAIDLHGATVAEAEVIVLEVLERRGKGQLRIVTGRGNHSVGGASVLKPALRKRLNAEGYVVKAWDAGLVVTIP